MLHVFCPANESRRGVALVWVALLCVALVGMMGLALDTAYAFFAAHQLQNAADASALAGALRVRVDLPGVVPAATDIAGQNLAAGEPVVLAPNPDNDAAGDVVVGHYDKDSRTFTATLTTPNAVKVRARRTADSPGGPVPLFFAPIFGLSDVDISRWAIAVNGTANDLGVVVLDHDDPRAFYAYGDSTLSVEGPGSSHRGIYVNSSHVLAAARLQGDPIVQTSGLRVVGGAQAVGALVPPPIYDEDAPIEDPLGDLEEPSPAGMTDLGAITCSTGQVRDLMPGYYSGGISATGGTLNLAPGVYILEGDGLDIGGNTSLFADEVMLFIKEGKIDLRGTGDVQITPPSSGPYQGISIFQSRTNYEEARFTGTSLNIQGTIYIPEAHVTMGGTSGTSGVYGNALIVKTLETFGTNEVRVVYDRNNFIPGLGSFLVE